MYLDRISIAAAAAVNGVALKNKGTEKSVPVEKRLLGFAAFFSAAMHFQSSPNNLKPLPLARTIRRRMIAMIIKVSSLLLSPCLQSSPNPKPIY
jgi:hypothetical protein